jgi:molybdopterin adenylyltransferase
MVDSTTAAEAYAFRQLVAHLQQRTDVQNIEMMILSGPRIPSARAQACEASDTEQAPVRATGFCRNCLSKWYHVGAAHTGMALSYEDACAHVYGMSYNDWKKTHQSKASEEQLRRLEETKAGHAKHSPPPPVAAVQPSAPALVAPTAAPMPPTSSGGMSDVCCVPASELEGAALTVVSPHRAPAPELARPVEIRLGVLTVSDRAHQGVYADLSGPEVTKCMRDFAATRPGAAWRLTAVHTALVPDAVDLISTQLSKWSQANAEGDRDQAECNLILTTGGTGLSPRDVTPEATASVVDRQAPGIPELLLREAIKHEPLAALSRAVAGVRGATLIVNLPGRPKAVRENLAVLMPMLGHALIELAG